MRPGLALVTLWPRGSAVTLRTRRPSLATWADLTLCSSRTAKVLQVAPLTIGVAELERRPDPVVIRRQALAPLRPFRSALTLQPTRASSSLWPLRARRTGEVDQLPPLAVGVAELQ